MRLGHLQEVYGRPGPFATVYLDLSTTPDQAWPPAREALARQGADEPTLRALDDHVTRRAWAGQPGQVLVAERGEVVLSDDLPQAPVGLPEQEMACFDAVPHLMTYLRLRGPRIPHVVAIVDRLGAGLRIVHATSEAEISSVEGADHPAHAGGERTEEQARARTADLVAAEVSRQARRVGARAVVLAGEAHQRHLVLERLEGEVRDSVVETEAGHDDHHAVDEPLRRQIDETIEALVHSRVSEAVQEFEQQRGDPERVVEGMRSTLAALRREQVRTLLWSAPVDPSERRLQIGARPRDVAVDEAVLGVAAVATVPASTAVVRALAGSSAELVLVDPEKVELADGVGGVLGTPGT
jgi:hypothetical protein